MQLNIVISLEETDFGLNYQVTVTNGEGYVKQSPRVRGGWTRGGTFVSAIGECVPLALEAINEIKQENKGVIAPVDLVIEVPEGEVVSDGVEANLLDRYTSITAIKSITFV